MAMRRWFMYRGRVICKVSVSGGEILCVEAFLTLVALLQYFLILMGGVVETGGEHETGVNATVRVVLWMRTL